MQSVSPKEAAIWIADKRDTMHDREFRAIYLEYDAGLRLAPRRSAPPRASGSHQTMARQPAHKSKRSNIPVPDPTIVRLVATSFGGMSPAWDRLGELAKQRSVGD